MNKKRGFSWLFLLVTVSVIYGMQKNCSCNLGRIKCPLGCNAVVSVRRLEKHFNSCYKNNEFRKKTTPIIIRRCFFSDQYIDQIVIEKFFNAKIEANKDIKDTKD